MVPTYLYILNDTWFDVEQIIKDTKGEFYLSKKPLKGAKGDKIYLYLSGGTKAVKYEAVITDASITWGHMHFNFAKYYIGKGENPKSNHPHDKPMIRLKIVREIENIDQTTPKLMKENGNILGSVMSNRELKPISVEWLDSIK